jgi:catechol 2,3-dioxygenase-like lactoylglutathione lyase family enzyme
MRSDQERPVAGPRLDHVQVAAPPGCADAARAFYGDLLGLAEVEKPEPLRGRGGVWFEQLHVGVEPDFTPARKAHPALRVDDVDRLAERLRAAGAKVQWDHALPGVRRFYTADPWGNRIELLSA